ncbi:MAG: sulfatase [Candidatus Rokuibacteriota bacterium]
MTGIRHLVLVTIDTLRADHLGCLGYARPTTPRLDGLVRSEGVLFSRAYSQAPHTAGSMPSLFTSTYPFMHGGEGRVEPKGLTMAEGLSACGFVTAGLHSNPFLSRAYGHDKGFQHFDDNFLLGVARPLIFLHRAVNYLRYEPYLTGRELNRKAFRWLRGPGHRAHRDGSRIFLWLHYMNVHGPYHPPAAYQRLFLSRPVSVRERHRLWKKMIHHGTEVTEAERRLLVDLYDAEIRCMDDCFAELMDELDRLGLRRESLIVVTADHGEEFGEHDGYLHLKQLYDEVLHVPLILFGEGLPRGREVSDLVRLIDVAPTAFDLLGVPKPTHFMGTSLAPLLRDEFPSLGLDAFCEVIGRHEGERSRKFALRTTGFKYIVEYDSALRVVGQELYDLAADPGERVNLVHQRPADAQALDRRLRQYINQTRGLEAPLDIPADDEVERDVKARLRDLGYIE